MTTEITLEELDLSVRSFNCLKRAGIDTLADIFFKLDTEGIEGMRKVRNLGNKSLEEVLGKVQEKGYNVIPVLDRYIDETTYLDEDAKQFWRGMKERLRMLQPPITPEEITGTRLSELKGMNYGLARRMRTNSEQPIATVEELIEQFEDEEKLLLNDVMKWRVLRILDENGYRLRGCSKDQWPDIEDYIAVKRARRISIEDLALPDEIADTLSTAGITASRLIEEKHTFLHTYFNNGEIATILSALDINGLRMKDAPAKEYKEITDFIVAHIEIQIDEIGLSQRTVTNLTEHGITTVNALLKYNRQQLLEQGVVGIAAVSEIARKLHKKYFHLTGDCFYSCSKCGENFAAPDDGAEEHYCQDCSERIKRVKKIQDFQVTIEGPDYSSYTDGTRGFTLYATLHNKSKKMVSATLREFMVFSENRQWASTSYLTGYQFITEHIMPQSSKTAAKIWSGSSWSDRELSDDDYVTVAFDIKGKVYSYKFVLRDSKFEIDDYHTF